MSDLAMRGSSTTSAPKGATYWLAILAAITTVALTAAAFWLSYEHLHDIADESGLNGARAWAWPATVDLFIVAGELLILRASLRRTGMDWWAVALAATGSLGSIALNVAGVGGDAQPMEYIVAAVPPAAALLAFGAIMRQVHSALAAPETVEHAELSREQGQQLVRDVLDLPEPTEQPKALDMWPAEQPEQLTRETPEQPERDRFLTTKEVAARFGVEMSTVGTWKQRGRIAPALVDPRVGNLYDPETLPPAASAG